MEEQSVKTTISRNHNHPDKLQGKKRSSQWSKIRKQYLADHPECEICGSKEKLEVHHKNPFHVHPELELDPKNLIALCESKQSNCHLKFGHRGSFRNYNSNIEEDAVTLKKIFMEVNKHTVKA